MEDSEEVQKGPGKKRGPLWRGSIASKLTIAFLALAIIPMSATAYYNLTQSRSELARTDPDCGAPRLLERK
ncbi:MAG: hypothetical protein KAX25_02940 [Dehalococcoidia bacterium]|nr:hypothetical protein [Dehalococcoidia bacterium]